MLAVAVVAVTFVQQRSPAPDTARPTGLRGTLVYAADDEGAVRLFLWNLETGEVSEGPEVPPPLELVDAFESAPGTVGLIWSTDTGQRAGVLRHLGARDTWTPAVEGDLVAWAPGGRFVSAVTVDAAGTGCRVVVQTFEVASADLVGESSERESCGSLVALVRSRSDPYVTVRDGEIATTRPLGAPAIPTLNGWVPVGVSPLGSFLILPDRGLPGSGARWLAWFSRGVGSPGEPIAFGVGEAHLSFERLLGWSPGGRGAYILGSYRGARGVYLVAVDSGDSGRPPVQVAPVDEPFDVRVTETAAGTAIVAIDDGFYRVSDLELVPLPLPVGAPAPAGPILWLSTVADSSG